MGTQRGSVWPSLLRSVAVTAAAALLVGAAVGSPPSAQESAAAYASEAALPSLAADVGDIEATALELAHGLGAVAVSEEQHDIACPRERLEVWWREPVGFVRGALVEPVGPAPGQDTRLVNGVVVCAGSSFSFMGFQAKAEDPWGWRVTAVPFWAHNDVGPEPLELRYLDGLDPLFGSFADLGPVDDYADFEPQRLCHAVPKPGTVALASLLLETYPGTQSLGIARDCNLGPVSEHKEGRAFDWGVSAALDDEAAAAEGLLQRLLATDLDGNRHALARRMGVMYIIWDGHIWSSYLADEGWRPYAGPSAHTDHVHISLSWDGALGRTSLWQVALDGIDLAGLELGRLGELPPARGGFGDPLLLRRDTLSSGPSSDRAPSPSDTEDGTDGESPELTDLPADVDDGADEPTSDPVTDLTEELEDASDPDGLLDGPDLDETGDLLDDPTPSAPALEDPDLSEPDLSGPDLSGPDLDGTLGGVTSGAVLRADWLWARWWPL